MKTEVPVLGKKYNYFDDGKIKPSRRMEVIITEIVPFAEIDLETLNDWKEEVEECDWLYAKETEFFIKGDLKVFDDKIEKIIFVRTINNSEGWFSLGYWTGRLDIDGTMNNLLKFSDQDKMKKKLIKLQEKLINLKDKN